MVGNRVCLDIAALVMTMRYLEEHATADEVWIKAFEPRDTREDFALE